MHALRALRHVAIVAFAALASAGAAGCGGQDLERRAHQAHMSAAMHQQRASALEAQAAQLRAIVLVQQVLLVTMAKPAPPTTEPARSEPRAEVARSPMPLPKKLLDENGAPLSTTSFGPVGEIVARAEAYLGRPLSGPERTALSQVLRRPRRMDPTSPWPVIQ